MARYIRSRSSGQRMTVGNGQAVGQFHVVQDGPAAAGATDHRGAAAGRVLPAIGVRLEISQRQRRLLPAIEPQPALALGRRGLQQRLVDRHVPRAGGGRIEEKEEG